VGCSVGRRLPRLSTTLQPAVPADVLTSHPCYAAAMIHDLITAIMVTSAAVLASELLVRVWEFF
jgi:hypothetical protein